MHIESFGQWSNSPQWKWCASSVEQQTREISTVAFSFDGRRTSVALALKVIVAQAHLNGSQTPKAARQMQEL